MYEEAHFKKLEIGKKYHIKVEDWQWTLRQVIPIRIVSEYEHFYEAVTLSHRAFYGMSTPQIVTLNKANLTLAGESPYRFY